MKKNDDSTKKKKPNDKHRIRLKKKFDKSGLDIFEDHEALELMLFYVLPRVNTNHIAHALMERFGTFSGVLDAEISELQKIDGMGENAARFLKMLPQVAAKYRMDKFNKRITLDDMDAIGEYLTDYYLAHTRESVLLLLFDNKVRLLETVVLSVGSINSASFSPRRIFELAVQHSATSFIIAHNHPHGLLVPSDADISTTTQLWRNFDAFELPMQEHILVAEDGWLGIVDYIRKQNEVDFD